jgi:16S rRNA (guanine(966)-N(2))-methyltransferase RsmD
VRIIGGAWKRTPLVVPAVAGLRPTPDRVRVTLFDWLAHLRPDTAALRGLDLFAGTGALGLELASRGAREVVLVERDPLALRALAASLARLATPSVQVLAGDAMAAVAGWPAGRFDLVFLDPPFDSALLAPALRQVPRLLASDGLVYAESPMALDEAVLAEAGLQRLRAGRAGQVHFHLLQRHRS